MQPLIAEELARYVHEHTSPEPEILERLRAETFETLEGPEMQVGRVEGTFLKLVVQISGARHVLELGTYSGYSALAMASGLPEEGRLVTCDIDPVATAVARRYFDLSPWGRKIELRLGPAIETLRALNEEGARFDLVFIDADKENYVHYFEGVLPLLRGGGVILADNALWSGAVLHPSKASDHGMVAFNKRVQADDRVEQVLLSVRDGIMFCRKKG